MRHVHPTQPALLASGWIHVGALAAAALCGVACAQAETPAVRAVYAAPPVVAAAPDPAPLLNASQMDALTAPIALYPDPLLAQVLAASTYPDDIASAAAWLKAHPNPTDEAINAQPWDPSVKALLHYPSVLQRLAADLEWTQALGAAFVNQQQDVIKSIQRLRARAEALGALQSSAQQQVVVEPEYIEILPVQPDYVFVPVYDPLVCFGQPGYIYFHDYFPLGAWCDLGFDWHRHSVCGGFRWHHFRPGHRVDHPPWIRMHPWHHDPRRPIPSFPPRFHPHAGGPSVRPGDKPRLPPPRAFSPIGNRIDIERAGTRGHQSQPPTVRPAPAFPPLKPSPTPPAPVRPAPTRVVPVRPVITPSIPLPRPTPVIAPRPAPARPVVPPTVRSWATPRPAPVVRPAPAPIRPASPPTFRPAGRSDTAIQSSRGHQSLRR
jgi:hypothetical protein